MDPKLQAPHAGPTRQRGRPRELVDPSEMSIRMNAELHDRLIVEANRLGIAPGKLARQLLDRALKRTVA